MTVINVACPYCGRETFVTQPYGVVLEEVSRVPVKKPRTQAACSHNDCRRSFYVKFRKL